MSSQEITWGKPGTCPSCGVLTEHVWFNSVYAVNFDFHGNQSQQTLQDKQGLLCVSQCVSQQCKSLALWFESRQERKTQKLLVYPRVRGRIPPAEGLEPDEVKLYKEAVDVSSASLRAACALLRVLLEALLKRYLIEAGQSVNKKHLEELIELAVNHLALSQTLKNGLTAIRKRGNKAVHDPYGLTDDKRTEDLPWLFQAVDDLVDDLHVKPQKWESMV